MGSSQPKSTFEEQNWRFVQQQGHKTILFNDAASKSVEKHEATVPVGQSLIKEIYDWRTKLQPSSQIVQVYEYGIRDGGFCQGEVEAYVITERVYLFEDIGEIGQTESFIILKDVVKGLQTLYKSFGFFQPNTRCFGINAEGKTKIWIDENFAVCSTSTYQIETSQLSIVNNLVGIISSKAYIEKQETPLKYPFNLNFDQTVKYCEDMLHFHGLPINKIFRNREEYAECLKAFREREETKAKSRLFIRENNKKMQEIQHLKLMLEKQKTQLAQKQLNFRVQQQPQQVIVKHVPIEPRRKMGFGYTSSTNESVEMNSQAKTMVPQYQPHQNLQPPRKMINQEKQIRVVENNDFPVCSVHSFGKKQKTGPAHEELKRQLELVDSMLLLDAENVLMEKKSTDPKLRRTYSGKHKR